MRLRGKRCKLGREQNQARKSWPKRFHVAFLLSLPDASGLV
jgi:hypothetical protein